MPDTQTYTNWMPGSEIRTEKWSITEDGRTITAMVDVVAGKWGGEEVHVSHDVLTDMLTKLGYTRTDE